jgi:hypothetical protein
MYVCVVVPAGTVYCTCAHVPHEAGAKTPPEPVLPYTTSAPTALKMRIVVEPEHVALESKELHMLATNVWPAEAVTPQVAKLTVSDPVFEEAKGGHSSKLVGAAVGNGEGLGVGAVGAGEGFGVGKKACTVGAMVGNTVGIAVGGAVVGPNVGKKVGEKDGFAVGIRVGGD